MTDKAFIDRLLLLIDEAADGNKSRFAELMGAIPSNINDWVNKGYFPKHEHLANLKEKLNVNINWLLTGIGPRYLTNNDRVKESEAEYIPRTYTDEEREAIKQVLEILRGKNEAGKTALLTSIKALHPHRGRATKPPVRQEEIEERQRKIG